MESRYIIMCKWKPLCEIKWSAGFSSRNDSTPIIFWPSWSSFKDHKNIFLVQKKMEFHQGGFHCDYLPFWWRTRSKSMMNLTVQSYPFLFTFLVKYIGSFQYEKSLYLCRGSQNSISQQQMLGNIFVPFGKKFFRNEHVKSWSYYLHAFTLRGILMSCFSIRRRR